jgi:hypothetical protein
MSGVPGWVFARDGLVQGLDGVLEVGQVCVDGGQQDRMGGVEVAVG